jgi:transcriptional regulator with XRE-family HTH domain
MSNLGENIKALRLKKGLTQQSLADQLRLSRSTLAKYESGERIPDIHTLLSISRILETDFGTLLNLPPAVQQIGELKSDYQPAGISPSDEMVEALNFFENHPEVLPLILRWSRLSAKKRKKLTQILRLLLDDA